MSKAPPVDDVTWLYVKLQFDSIVSSPKTLIAPALLATLWSKLQ